MTPPHLEYRVAVAKCIASALFIIVSPLAFFWLIATIKPVYNLARPLFLGAMIASGGMAFVWLIVWPRAFKQLNGGHLPFWTGVLAAVLGAFLVLLSLVFFVTATYETF
jgi:hypothetical protein